VVDIKECNKPKVLRKLCNGDANASAMLHVNQTELTRKLNLQRNYFTLVERHFLSKND